jgi:hypothetical protein
LIGERKRSTPKMPRYGKLFRYRDKAEIEFILFVVKVGFKVT